MTVQGNVSEKAKKAQEARGYKQMRRSGIAWGIQRQELSPSGGSVNIVLLTAQGNIVD